MIQAFGDATVNDVSLTFRGQTGTVEDVKTWSEMVAIWDHLRPKQEAGTRYIPQIFRLRQLYWKQFAQQEIGRQQRIQAVAFEYPQRELE